MFGRGCKPRPAKKQLTINFLKMKQIIIGLLLLLCNGVSYATDFFPPPFTAEYKIYAAGISAGVGTRTLINLQDGKFQFQTVAKTTGFISFFKKIRIEEHSTFTQANGKIRPLKYTYRQTGSKTRFNEVLFDWVQKKAISTFKNQTKEISLREGMLDRLVYQVMLMQELKQGKRQLSYVIATKGKTVVYTPIFLGKEYIDTGVGRLETLKYKRQSSNNKRYTILWCAPTLHYLPVQIKHVETDGDVFSMVLQSVRGLD